jgi:hypothetical protein
VIDVDEDGWLVVEAGSVAATAAGEHTCALGEGVRDVALDDLELRRKGHCTDVARAGGGIAALAEAADCADELVDELLVDLVLDVDALDRGADLAAVPQPEGRNGIGGAVEVRVGAHDHRVLAAELERHRDQPARARRRPGRSVSTR